MKKLINKIIDKLIDINNKKILEEMDDYNFLISLCTIKDSSSSTGRLLDLNKFNRLMKMVKRKYK